MSSKKLSILPDKNLEGDGADFQELLVSHNQELAIDKLTEMHEHEQKQDIEEHEYSDTVKPEDRMAVENLTEGPSLIEKVVLQISEIVDSNEERIFSTEQGIKKNKNISMLREKFGERNKNLLSRRTFLLGFMKSASELLRFAILYLRV
ncbi:hypothetical protein TNCV_381061 [Trichonephila clavipes]|uniref:Uncharacterized protein n=1 Tax=Trichonephila clavipes TaxID=2585209 RepID=A0A8X6SAM1_TRICX|nr:hypothetical protein TNCV_381061 [Trichonephila clavipes]